MTSLYVTIDTEYSLRHFVRVGRHARAENFDVSIAGKTANGAAGISYQMDVFDRHGLKAVFFVDPMPALIWGTEAIADIVGPIVARGHDVQLHIHTEWLKFAGASNPLGNRIGRNIKDFSFEEQCALLDYARDVLVSAGAPQPVAFRAGNYGANDDTLRALAHLGIAFDSSHCPGIQSSECEISLSRDDWQPCDWMGVVEVPVSYITGPSGGRRHFQLSAVSDSEILAALRHAVRDGQKSMTLVSHSFEVLSRDRSRIDQVLKRRFETMCAKIEKLPGVSTATYADAPPVLATMPARPLSHNPLRTARRYVEQGLTNIIYGNQLDASDHLERADA